MAEGAKTGRAARPHDGGRARKRPHRPTTPLRLLTAVPICDGHDSAINTINLEFIRHGFEVVYLGYHRSVRDIVRGAIQEDVRAIGLSSYNGGHVEFFADVINGLRSRGAGHIALFGGGGGTITSDDAAIMRKAGVDCIVFPGTPLEEMVNYVHGAYGAPAAVRPSRTNPRAADPDGELAKLLTAAESGQQAGPPKPRRGLKHAPSDRDVTDARVPLVIGITGPGGAGKTTLIDELVLRYLRSSPAVQVAVLSHDPSLVENGALLGDRATMIHSQNDRVFMRSLASRGQAGGLSSATERCLSVLRSARGGGAKGGDPDVRRFDAIFVETVGIGQEAFPFPDGWVDISVLVMSPDYGSRLQLQKIVMLDGADVVVVNKADRAGARTASSEIEQRLALNHRSQRLIVTQAKRHRDSGVDELFSLLTSGTLRAARAGRG